MKHVITIAIYFAVCMALCWAFQGDAAQSLTVFFCMIAVSMTVTVRWELDR